MDDRCFNCDCRLPDKDPDPFNTGADPWWDGYCSVMCREGVPVPSDESQLSKLDAYGHLAYAVGWNGEMDDEDAPERGDWLACFDYIVWRHPSRGVLVAYHVVVDSDSGGFTETPEQGVVTACEAPYSLASYWLDIALQQCPCFTEEEWKSNMAISSKWETDLRREVMIESRVT